MATREELFSPDKIRELSLDTSDAGQKTAEKMLADVAKRTGRLMVEAAYAIFAAMGTGITNKRVAEIFGRGSAWVTLERRLGYWLVIGGADNGPAWNLLANKSKASAKEISKLLDEGDDQTDDPAVIEKRLTELFMPNGAARPATRGAGEPGQTGDPEVFTEWTRLMKAAFALTPKMDSEVWAKAETDVTERVSREVKRRLAVNAAAKRTESGAPEADELAPTG